MPKGKLEFDLDDLEDRKAFIRASKADDLSRVLYEIGQQVFRPARKHGYQDNSINDIINKFNDVPQDEENTATALIGMLEEKFYEIIKEYDVSNLIE